jgi:hypothetical protein
MWGSNGAVHQRARHLDVAVTGKLRGRQADAEMNGSQHREQVQQ